MSTLLPTLPRVAPPPPLSDEELVASILGGSGAALELLMRRHNQRLFRLARAVVRDSSEAEDIVQETYVRAYTNLDRFEGRSSVATWLSRIALHEALRTRRRLGRASAMSPVDMDRVHAANPGEAGSDPMDRTETRTMLTVALDSLPAGLRAVVMLRLVEGLSTRETAECLRLTESSVKVSLHRARRSLAETIQRRAISDFRQQFTFAEQRCDRIVAGVFRRLDVGAVGPAATRPTPGEVASGLTRRVGVQFHGVWQEHEMQGQRSRSC